MREPRRPRGRRIRNVAIVLGLTAIVLVIGLRLVHQSKVNANTPATPVPAGGGTAVTPSTVTVTPSTVTQRGQVTQRTWPVGACLMWDPTKAHTTPVVVPCTKPHVFQVSADLVLKTGRYPTTPTEPCRSYAVSLLGGTPWPTTATWKASQGAPFSTVVTTTTPTTTTTQPSGPFYVDVGLAPTTTEWEKGDHSIVCGVTIVPDPKTALLTQLFSGGAKFSMSSESARGAG